MKRMGRCLIILLCLLLAACEAKPADVQESHKSGSEFYDNKITVAFCGNPEAVEQNEAAKALLEQITGLSVDLLCISENLWADKMNKTIAAGKIPEMILCRERRETENFVSQNVLAELPYEEVANYAPKLYQTISDAAWFYTRFENQNWGIPFVSENLQKASLLIYNREWLDRLGVSEPPVTLEETEALFERFVHEDPDGNGLDDTYAICPAGRDNILTMLPEVFLAYGVSPAGWMPDDNGTLQLGITRPQAKQAVETLRRWYAKGYIDPEFLYTDGEAEKKKWSTQKTGVVRSDFFSLTSLAEHHTPVVAAAPTGSTGVGGYLDYGETTGMVVFGKQLMRQPKLLRELVAAVEQLTTDAATAEKLWGVTETAQNEFATNDAEKKTEPKRNLGFAIPFMPTKTVFNSLVSQFDTYDFWGHCAENSGETIGYIPELEDCLSSEVHRQMQDAVLLIEQWMVDYISGRKDTADYDTFFAQWQAAAGASVTEAVNEAYRGYVGAVEQIGMLRTMR